MANDNLDDFSGRKLNWWFIIAFAVAWVNIFVLYLFWIDIVHFIAVLVMDICCLLVVGMAIHAHMRGRAYWYFMVGYQDTLGVKLSVRRRYTKRALIIISIAVIGFIAYSIVALVKKYHISVSVMVFVILGLLTFAFLINQRYLLEEPKEEIKNEEAIEEIQEEESK